MTAYVLRCGGEGCGAETQLPGALFEAVALAEARGWMVVLEGTPLCPGCVRRLAA